MEAGQQVHHYRLIRQIGEGGMGVVWEAEDTRLHRRVALKFVSGISESDDSSVDRHLREARAVSALNHPHICSLHDIGEWEGHRYLVMELLEGRSLDRRLVEGPLESELVTEIALQVAAGLAVAHKKGIVHRDIKPANIFLVEDEAGSVRAKILDFGLAKRTEPAPESGSEDETLTAHLETRAGVVVGTASYMSPEQALGKELDERSDIFSLGAVLYEMTTGERAFKGQTAAALFDAILNRSPGASTPGASAEPGLFDPIVRRALEKDPQLRYQSVEDLAVELRRLRQGSSSSTEAQPATPQTTKPLHEGRLRWLPLAAPVVLLALALTWLATRTPPGDAASATASLPAEPPGTAAAAGPTIAVLPFENATGDPDQEYMSGGLTEELITALAGYRELSVTAHTSTARYKNREVSLADVSEDLGVRYVLEGTLRAAGESIRLNVQLSDASNGTSVWGESYERDLTATNLFDLQDELAQQVANAVAGSYGALARLELPRARREAPSNLASYHCVLRAYDYLQNHVGETHLAARECLEEVVEKEPDYVDGLAWLAYLYAEEHHHRRNQRPDEYDALERALELATEAVRLDSASTVAHGALALTRFFRGEYERGRIEAYRTVELAPNNALWLTLLGTYLVQLEDFEGGLPIVQHALSLNPHPQPWVRMAFFFDDYHNGRYDEALVEARSLDLGDDYREPLFIAATLGQLGRLQEAEPLLEALREAWQRPWGEMRADLIERHAFSPALADHLLAGLEKAGFVLPVPVG